MKYLVADSLSEVEARLSNTDLLGEGFVSALYVSAGRDTKPLTFLHSEHLERKSGRKLLGPDFFIYVDANSIETGIAESLSFEDDENATQIRATDLGQADLGDTQGRLLSIKWKSGLYSPRDYVIWVLSCSNDWFTRFALGEGWRPTWFIGVGDACPWQVGDTGEYGQPCVNSLRDTSVSIPIQLGTKFWVTDHVVEARLNGEKLLGGEDPVNGDILISEDPTSGATLTQVGALSGLFECETTPGRFKGGARVFEMKVPE